MTKQEILEYFSDINHAYNDCGKLDSLSYMIDELFEDIKAEICQTLDVDWSDGLYQALRIIDKHIGNGKEKE